MILVDASVWTDHLRQIDSALFNLLNENLVCIHPYVTGEIALGYLKNRTAILDALRGLPQVSVATNDEVMHFIDQNKLYGIGIGYADAHILAAARLTGNCTIWTRDKRLNTAAIRLNLDAANLYH
jgi:predicted nucleic acid-binding protein